MYYGTVSVTFKFYLNFCNPTAYKYMYCKMLEETTEYWKSQFSVG